MGRPPGSVLSVQKADVPDGAVFGAGVQSLNTGRSGRELANSSANDSEF